MADNLSTLLPKLTKQDRDNIWFAVWQLRLDKRSALANCGIAAIAVLAFDDVLDALREADVKGLLPDGAARKTIENLQSFALAGTRR